MISATPHDLDRELTDIALEQGPGQERLKLLRELVLRSATEPESRQLLNQFDPNHTLKADSPDAAFSRLWYARHGAYPVDGYILYSHEVNGAASDQAAAAYYNNPNVAKFTTIYCPHTPDQD